MKMHLLSGGRLRMRRGIYYPGAAKEETMEMPVSCTLLKHPQGLVLFDTGCHPSVINDAEARWGSLARFMTPVPAGMRFEQTERPQEHLARGRFHLLGHVGSFFGGARQDLMLSTNPGGAIWLYRNPGGASGGVPTGTGKNVTLY